MVNAHSLLKCMHSRTILHTCCLALLAAATSHAAIPEVIAGNVRVQLLSPTLVRIEEKGAAGFEDRPTFTVVERSWPGASYTSRVEGTTTIITAGNYEVRVPAGGSRLSGSEAYSQGTLVYRVPDQLPNDFTYPDPGSMGKGFAMPDKPRLIPPAWGATSIPPGALSSTDPLYNTSGWDTNNNAMDVYVFIEAGRGYAGVRQEFLRLTGPIPMLPLYALGFWRSRWEGILQDDAIALVNQYHGMDFPLDVMVLDKDWRAAENDYTMNTGNFPNVTKFFSDLHGLGVRAMFNEHPQPYQNLPTLDPAYMQWRYDGLTKIMGYSLDSWWFDSNWPNIFPGPMGMSRIVWGERMYYDAESRFRPTERALILSMYDELHPAKHRYPVYWTGDVGASWGNLAWNIKAAVDGGIQLLPWITNDGGGYIGSPTTELYLRWLEYGALSPIMRVHCDWANYRDPWKFGQSATNIVTAYAKLRYRLMPMLYAANRRAYEDGTPVLRRNDLLWTGAANSSQYLLGDDLLVRPTTKAGADSAKGVADTVAVPAGDWENAWTGEVIAGPKNVQVSPQVWMTPMFIRRGAIIPLAPDMLTTGEKPWSPLTIEFYPPSTGTVTRGLYEDDGHSVLYRTGAFARTQLSVARNGSNISASMSSSQGTFEGKLSARSWIARVHCSAQERPQQVCVNGSPVTIGAGTWRGNAPAARFVEPQAWPSPVTSSNFPIPLKGEGAAPPLAAGPVVEVWIPNASLDQALSIALGSPADCSASSIGPKVRQVNVGAGAAHVDIYNLRGCLVRTITTASSMEPVHAAMRRLAKGSYIAVARSVGGQCAVVSRIVVKRDGGLADPAR